MIRLIKHKFPLKKEAEKALKTTFLEARVFNSGMIGTTHLLLCILRNNDDPTTKFLRNYHITYEKVKELFINKLEEELPEDKQLSEKHTKASISEHDKEEEMSKGSERFSSSIGSKKTKSNTPVLDNFGRDLTQYAEDGKLDPVIGRTEEIERVSQILSRRKK